MHYNIKYYILIIRRMNYIVSYVHQRKKMVLFLFSVGMNHGLMFQPNTYKKIFFAKLK